MSTYFVRTGQAALDRPYPQFVIVDVLKDIPPPILMLQSLSAHRTPFLSQGLIGRCLH